MFHVETALDDAALIARLCDRDHETPPPTPCHGQLVDAMH